MATFTVTNLDDSGTGSLREAIGLANASIGVADTIVFQAGLAGQITLTGGELVLTDDVVIDGDTTGDNKADIVISGNGSSRVFDISGAGTDVDLLSLTLTGGATFGNGGAIQIVGGSLDISDTTIRDSFAGSAAGFGGGAIYSDGAALTITSSLLTENSGQNQGGALKISGGSAIFVNTTIHNNAANDSNFVTSGSGGGIFADGGAVLTLVNSTVTNNSASGPVSSSGGGIASGGTLNLINTVVADNTAGGYANIQGTINTNTNNFIGTSPGLGALEDNGGTTLTRDILTGSALVNAGTNSPPGGLPATDANGNDRTVGTVDIGATERQLVVTNTNDSGAGSLRQAILDANANADFSLIQFDASLTGQTINVGALGTLTLSTDIRIDGDVNGDNKADITISGGDARRIMFISGAGTDVELRSLTLTGGNAGGGYSGGGIAAVNAGSVEILDTTITGNTAGFGGGIATFSTALTIANSLISGNSAGHGGGLYSQNADATLQNTTVHDNSATGFGGGIHAFSGSLLLFNSTVTGNSADTDGASTLFGGGLRLAGTNYSVLYNSVVADNFSGTGLAEHDVFGTVSFAGNSALGAGTAIGINGGGNLAIVETAGLGPLADNGGTVQTLAPETGSLLIGAGSPSRITSDTLDIDSDGNTTEQLAIDGRGGLREIATVDIGAVEARAPLIVTTATDVVNAGDGVLSLREAVTLANADGVPDSITFAASLAGQMLTLTGGALALTASVTIDGDTNGDNKSDITISGGGTGGIFDQTGAATDVQLLSLTLTGGSRATGGAIDASGGSLDIRDSTISGNSTTFQGGGIFADGTALTIMNSAITGNTGGVSGGGGISVVGGTTFLVNSTVHGNTAIGYGGGLVVDGNLTILNSTITGNRAASGGAVTNSGGGLAIASGSLTVSNSVVADNISGNGSVENDVYGTVATANASIFGTAVAITTNNGSTTGVANVGLGALLDNGGTVLTRSPLDGSVLIGAAGNLSIQDLFDLDGDGNRLESLPLDGRGGLRIVGGARDMGAVEQIVDETIGGTAAGDTILGGLGDDILRGRGGNDTLNGGGGNDTADYSEATGTGVTVNLNLGDAQLISATQGSDTLIGIENITGSSLNDTLTGNGAANIIDGGLGNDTMAGGGGNDIYVVRAGDTVSENANEGYDTVNTTRNSYVLPANVERVNFIGSGNFVGTGSNINNRFQGGTGDDRFVDVLGGADIFSGNAGTDTVDFRSSAAGAVIDMATLVHAGAAAGDSYSGIEKFLGSNTAGDTMTGGGTGRWIFAGGGGGDTLTGGVKNDQLLGQGGNDTLSGGADRDSLDGGTGNDTMTGGTQADVFVFVDAAFGQDTITDYQDGIDSFKIFSGVATSLADFTVTNNGTTSVTLTLNAAPVNFITINGAAPITITTADFVFY